MVILLVVFICSSCTQEAKRKNLLHLALENDEPDIPQLFSSISEASIVDEIVPYVFGQALASVEPQKTTGVFRYAREDVNDQVRSFVHLSPLAKTGVVFNLALTEDVSVFQQLSVPYVLKQLKLERVKIVNIHREENDQGSTRLKVDVKHFENLSRDLRARANPGEFIKINEQNLNPMNLLVEDTQKFHKFLLDESDKAGVNLRNFERFQLAVRGTADVNKDTMTCLDPHSNIYKITTDEHKTTIFKTSFETKDADKVAMSNKMQNIFKTGQSPSVDDQPTPLKISHLYLDSDASIVQHVSVEKSVSPGTISNTEELVEQLSFLDEARASNRRLALVATPQLENSFRKRSASVFQTERALELIHKSTIRRIHLLCLALSNTQIGLNTLGPLIKGSVGEVMLNAGLIIGSFGLYFLNRRLLDYALELNAQEKYTLAQIYELSLPFITRLPLVAVVYSWIQSVFCKQYNARFLTYSTVLLVEATGLVLDILERVGVKQLVGVSEFTGPVGAIISAPLLILLGFYEGYCNVEASTNVFDMTKLQIVDDFLLDSIIEFKSERYGDAVADMTANLEYINTHVVERFRNNSELAIFSMPILVKRQTECMTSETTCRRYEYAANNYLDMTEKRARYSETWPLISNPNLELLCWDSKPRFEMHVDKNPNVPYPTDFVKSVVEWMHNDGTEKQLYPCTRMASFRNRSMTSHAKMSVVELADGKDNIVGMLEYENTFICGHGLKFIEGGDLDDTFVLNSKTRLTTGEFIGGEGHNLLDLRGYLPNDTINLKLNTKHEGVQVLKVKRKPSQNLVLRDITRIIGRETQSDFVAVKCDTRFINLLGTNNNVTPDSIMVPDEPCGFSLQIDLSDALHINNSAQRGFFNYNVGKSVKNVKIGLKNTKHAKHVVAVGQKSIDGVKLNIFSKENWTTIDFETTNFSLNLHFTDSPKAPQINFTFIDNFTLIITPGFVLGYSEISGKIETNFLRILKQAANRLKINFQLLNTGHHQKITFIGSIGCQLCMNSSKNQHKTGVDVFVNEPALECDIYPADHHNIYQISSTIIKVIDGVRFKPVSIFLNQNDTSTHTIDVHQMNHHFEQVITLNWTRTGNDLILTVFSKNLHTVGTIRTINGLTVLKQEKLFLIHTQLTPLTYHDILASEQSQKVCATLEIPQNKSAIILSPTDVQDGLNLKINKNLHHVILAHLNNSLWFMNLYAENQTDHLTNSLYAMFIDYFAKPTLFPNVALEFRNGTIDLRELVEKSQVIPEFGIL